ncbi:hypothetical protein X781_15550 [Mannheimia sp. USDA-ARS-USMARC-1261]|uniref:Uncharacterized protein n=1 Tax=Mannheimia varigena USDA-ARS-USMARC-1296 TaxID=1433287 RepID=W0QCA8_9PAST|nr:hypothetical protein X781_15550 [Mannheimia sp. USDA-ARS-USMARC-1261]AHG75922.1 hypothetical protein X808_14000 [Mannheimia varigena USDA-ARS-USMARC-1296]
MFSFFKNKFDISIKNYKRSFFTKCLQITLVPENFIKN